MKLLLAVILIALCVLLVNSALLNDDPLKKELDIYIAKISVLYDLLAEECPDYNVGRREISTGDLALDLQVQKQLYTRLLKRLNECKKQNQNPSKKTTTEQPGPKTAQVKTTTPAAEQPTATTKVKPSATASTKQPTTTTKVKPSATASTKQPTTTTKVKPTATASTKQPTTTTKVKPSATASTKQQTTTTKVKPTTTTNVKPTPPQPIECQQAVNYTQVWRRDYNGSKITPGGPNSNKGWACDFHVNNTEWFRFTGAAGNRMLDRCPKWRSCGTVHPHWTDAKMPEVVGVESTVDVYAVRGSACKYRWYTKQVKVMRCSRDTEHDFIYKQTTNFTDVCLQAFCGMI